MKKLKSKLPTVRRALTGAMPDVLCVAGVGCIVYAAALVCTALAFAVGGAALIFAAFVAEKGGEGG
ncbi:MAG: hypothetical protein ACI3XY_07135 [Butyricicoccaceae bacterium]